MLGVIRGEDVDKELVDRFSRSCIQEWEIWTDEECPLEADIHRILIQHCPRIPERKVNGLGLVERNDTSVTRGCESSFSWVILPALELKFQDPDNLGAWFIVFVEGRENLNRFLRKFAGRLENSAGVKKAEEEVEIMYNE